MFDVLQEKLQRTFKRLKGHGRLSERNINEACQDIKLALLDADVHYRVVKDLIRSLTEKALGKDVLQSVTPAQQFIKLVHDELVRIMGAPDHQLPVTQRRPIRIMIVGLQGGGKTTSVAKLAKKYQDDGKKVLLCAGDVRRPAATEQLETLARPLNIPVFSAKDVGHVNHLTPALNQHIDANDYDIVLYDTSGRLQVDEALMAELQDIRSVYHPHEVLLVVDAMTGQSAVDMATVFNEKVGFDGLIMTKLDGDARGGAALSIKVVTGKSIKFVGLGEKIGDLEPFWPDRMASRILGKGDVVGFVEKVQQTYDEDQAKQLEEKFRKNTFDLEDFRGQLVALKKMGPLQDLMGMIPGVGAIKKNGMSMPDEKQMHRIEAMIQSMTLKERHHPEILNASRRRRVAQGSGTCLQDVNELLKKFDMMKKMTRNMSKSMKKMGSLSRLFQTAR